MSVEDVRKELEKDAQEGIERAGKDYVDSIREFNNVSAGELNKAVEAADVPMKDAVNTIERKPAETLDSQGYDPYRKPVDKSVDSSTGGNAVPGNNAAGQNATAHRGNGLPKQEGVGEQAPDMGKDYGSTPGGGDGYDRVGNGYNPYDDRVNQGQEQVEEQGKDRKQPEEKKKNTEEEKTDEKKGDSKKDPNGKKEDPETPGGKKGEKKDGAGTSENGTKKPETSTNPNQDGNGYGALKKKQNPNNGTDMSDPTSRARRNLQHNNQSKSGDKATPKKSSKPTNSTASKGSGIKNAINKAGAGLKNAANKLGNKNNGLNKGDKGSGGEKVANKAMGGLKNMILRFIMSHPLSLIVIAIIVIILIVLLFDAMDAARGGSGRGKRSCTYTLNGVTSTGTVELSNLKVEIINCDGKADNYEVLDTVDFEKYILGVALAEAGASSPDEALKAQMIAVRNFTLTRNSGMCPSHPESCFHGYNESTGIIRMRACTNDQVYWDYTKDCPKIERPGQPTLYCEGVDGSTDIWKKALSEERQKEVEALANSVMGEVLLDENGNVLKLGYQADETDKFIADANAGKSYVEILEGVYGSSSYSSAKCSYGGIFDYGDYTLSSENTTILHEPLEDFLEDNGTSLEEFNELIADNVDDAGWGTRAGVVAAAVTLIGELGDNYGVKVPYYWGGGHYDGVVDGALGYWGSTQCHTYANNQHYNYCGFDCSGFVPWAIKNGGFKKGVDLASNFQNMPNARKVKLTNEPQLQPGDLLESDGHIILVVGIDEASKQYICAEAMGNAYGVLFTRRSFTESGYWGVDLEDYYNDPNYIREPIR